MVSQRCLTSCFALPFLAHAADKFPFEELEQKNASASPTYDYVGYGAPATGAGSSWLHNSILKTMFDETMIGTSVFVAKPVSNQSHYLASHKLTRCAIDSACDRQW